MAGGNLVVGLSGASGALYAVRFLQEAARHFSRLYLIPSANAAAVMRQELDLPVDPSAPRVADMLGEDYGNIEVLERGDYFSPPASGSFRHDGMVVIPCSLGSAGRIAHGISNDLLTRAADVCLKERRPLILVVRETPLSLVHLRNLTLLAEAGATILPAAPAFYHKPQTIDDLVMTVVARVLQQLGVEQRIVPQWKVDD